MKCLENLSVLLAIISFILLDIMQTRLGMIYPLTFEKYTIDWEDKIVDLCQVQDILTITV